ncbi:alcohol dehydrogenase catalytic domain-containing protein, partial [Enterobacter cloacae]|uniref:alcohol dehydrogenase catalytic domain-containing protein n=1 Tax=Enterobacter cloacae TaxID=550 RepID=UPI003F6831E0
VQINAFGGPDVMKVTTSDPAAPGPGEAQLRQTAIGFNYIDVYQRSGIYPLPLPTGLGFEAAGTVEAVGPG